MDICSTESPTFRAEKEGHFVSCWLYEELADEVKRVSGTNS
jgi:hypothetical protein